MRKYIRSIILIFINLLTGKIIFSAENLAQKLSGKILLQVESYGKAWYINPFDKKKYYLGRPQDAFDLMHNLSIGITDKNLEKIPIGIIKYNNIDDDNDGLTNNLEIALGTNPQNIDSDNDGHLDRQEIENNYNPLGVGKLNIDKNFTKTNLGKIFLQTEKQGQAWYINPTDNKRYYLGKPADAFEIMKKLSLGITNTDINKISVGYLTQARSISFKKPKIYNNSINNVADDVINSAAIAISNGNIAQAKLYFISALHPILEYNINYLDSNGLNIWAYNLRNAKLNNSSNNKKTYSIQINFSGYTTIKEYNVRKQKNGSWLLANL